MRIKDRGIGALLGAVTAVVILGVGLYQGFGLNTIPDDEDECPDARLYVSLYQDGADQAARMGDTREFVARARVAALEVRDSPHCFSAEDVGKAKEFLLENGE